MPEWIGDLLMGPAYAIGNAIWNLIMAMVGNVLVVTPQGFSAEAWNFIANQLYPWALGIGVALLNLFFLVGFFKEASNIKENLTWEILINQGIKVIVANAFMQSGLSIIREFFQVASILSGQVYLNNIPPFSTEDIDFGSYLFFFIFGAIYVLAAIICGFMILLTVYGRYLKLYVMVVMAPVAMSTMAGGRGMEQSAYAWIKNFLVNVFEILVIAITMAVAGKMISSIDFMTHASGLVNLIDGFPAVLQSLFTMILMTAAVKGADSMLRQSFAL